MKTTLILNREYKKLPSATNILGDFCYIQFCYCTFGCTSKSQNRMWHRIQRAPWSSYRGVFTRETVKHLCQMMARYKVFVFVSFLFLSSVIKFDKKCANSTQRLQSPNSWGWPLFLRSQKFTLRDEAIYHQVIPSFWKYYFIIHQRHNFLLKLSWLMHALLTEHCHKNPPVSQFNPDMKIC